MSGQLPPRRRRIAGERRPRTETSTPTTPPTPTTTTTTRTAEPNQTTRTAEPVEPAAPVDLRKGAQPAEPLPAEPLPAEPARAEGRRGGWWGSRASLVALTVTLVLLLAVIGLGLAGLLGNRGLSELREASGVTEAEETAPSVAERAAEAILAYDHQTLEADKDAAQRFMTSQFAKKYSDTFTKTVEPAARTYKAQVTSKVQGTAVVRATAERVRVLVFVDQTTVATNKKNPQVALNRVELDMVLRNGSWLVDDITSY